MRFWAIADAAAPAIALGQAIGRLGCFGAGCDYGKPSDLPWAVTFTSDYASRNVGVPLNVSLHPTQLYESFATLLLCLMLYKIHRLRRFKGQVFACYMVGYGLIRFSNEFFRGDVGRGLFFDGQVSIHQLISISLILVAGVFIFQNRVTPVGSRSA
jgi:phosphatidylglycerol:prolipoprotein diacylglycerol transferase